MPKAKVKMPSREKQKRHLKKRREGQKAENRKIERDGGELWGVPDYGPPERWQHGMRVWHVEDDGRTVAARALEECALDTLRVAGVIAPALYTAGMELRRSYMRAGLQPRQAGRYQAGTGEKVMHREFVRSGVEEEHYTAWRAALLAAGVQTASVLVEICCIGRLPIAAEIPKLQEGLRLLYNHYRAERLRAFQPLSWPC